MRKSTVAALGGAAVGLAGGAAAAALTAAFRRRLLTGELPAEALHQKSSQMQYRQILEGAYRAVLWGDPDHGNYAGFTRFDPGVRHPLHKHSHDIVLVVLEGAYLYETELGVRRVEQGDCMFIPAGDVHRSGSDATRGCLMFELSSGAFDLKIVE